MTRERFHEIYTTCSRETLIDMLFNTITKYENRSCGNCKHTITDYKGTVICGCSGNDVEDWQGCVSKWEKKDD